MSVTTEPSAVAPDAGINLCPKQVPAALVFNELDLTTDITEVDFSIRRYRARFCKEYVPDVGRQTGKRLVSLSAVSSCNINQLIGIEEFRPN